MGLSVIIPTYRRKESVYKLLRLLKEQQGIDLQIVLIDQNSYGFFDKQAFENDNRVTYVHQASPNVAAARNTGFLKAVFETILFIDDDLEPDPHFCQSGMEIFEQYAEIGAFVPMVYDLQGETLAYRRNELYKLKQHSLNRHIFSISDTMSAAVFFRKSYFKRAGGFDSTFFQFSKTGEDQEFFLRMRWKRLTCWYIPFIKIFHNNEIPGGCELRTDEYLRVKAKCIRGMALRHYLHHERPGKFTIWDFWSLLRYTLLNREMLFKRTKYLRPHTRLLIDITQEVKMYFNENCSHYLSPDRMDHLHSLIKE